MFRPSLVGVVLLAAGTRLRYEVIASKDGPSGTTSTNQSGEVNVGESGTAALSRLALGLGADDRCNVAVRVYAGVRVVAEELFHVPE